MDLNEYKKLKQKVTDQQREADRAEGQLRGLLDRLRTEQDCKSVKEAELKHQQIKGKLVVTEQTFDKELKKFNAKWGDELDADS